MEEKYKIVGLILFFLGIYLMPAGSETFKQAVLGGVFMLNDYAQKHVLTCLVPAFFIAGGIAVFVRKELILKYLGGKANKVLAYAIASVSGAILAVCSCTIIPIFAGIHKRGAGLGPATTFLFSGPAINVAAIFLTGSVLGAKIGLARAVTAVVLSVLIGITMAAIFREKSQEGDLVAGESGFDLSKTTTALFFGSMVMVLIVNGLQIESSIKYALMAFFALVTAVTVLIKFKAEERREWLSEVWSFTKLLTPYLFVGVFIAGFIGPYLPRELVEGLVGQNTVTGNLAASIFGAFMYFSTLTEVPILQAFMAKGMHQGPALALLLSGPSLSLPSMLMIKSVLGTKKTTVYVLLVIVYSTIAGLIFGGM
ncbi:MAG: permease [Candidatus Altiarchaeota archaeon]|nr:permease [Candidatus Altiarchaeota archaeon]